MGGENNSTYTHTGKAEIILYLDGKWQKKNRSFQILTSGVFWPETASPMATKTFFVTFDTWVCVD